MVLERINQLLQVLLVREPIVLVLLDLGLGFRQALVKLLDILLRIEKLPTLSNLLKIQSYFFIELLGLLH